MPYDNEVSLYAFQTADVAVIEDTISGYNYCEMIKLVFTQNILVFLKLKELNFYKIWIKSSNFLAIFVVLDSKLVCFCYMW